MSIVDTVRELADGYAPELNLEVFDVEFAGGTLRITADRLEKAHAKEGADLAMLQKLSKKVARDIEEQDLISSGFTLEVSSPGLERKLRTPDHFRRSVGEQVKIKTFPGFEGDRRSEGTLVSADDEGITLAVDDNTNVAIRFDQIAKATTVFDWGPQEKPGKTPSNNGAKNTKKPENTENKEKRAAS